MHDHQHLFSWFEDIVTHELSASSHVLTRLRILSVAPSSTSLGRVTILSQYFIALSKFSEAKLSLAPKIPPSYLQHLFHAVLPTSLGRLVQGDRDRFQTNLFIIQVLQCLNDCFFPLCIFVQMFQLCFYYLDVFYLEILQPLAALKHTMCIAYECIHILMQIIW